MVEHSVHSEKRTRKQAGNGVPQHDTGSRLREISGTFVFHTMRSCQDEVSAGVEKG